MVKTLHSIEARSLSKSFGEVKAVDDITFAVDSGEIFGFLGPNGAGKSTAMMIFTTLLKPTSGQALVSGHDVFTNPGRVRQSIGCVQQETTVDEYLTGRENLVLQARLNHIQKNQMDARIDDILALIELDGKQNDPVVTYSGGMRKRLDIAGGLLHRPKVLFLDEPTVGLDIQTRRKIWEYIKRIHDEFDMSIFLTTHYMEEADHLCNRIGIIDHGKIQAIDSPQNMKGAMGNEVISLSFKGDDSKGFLRTLKEIPGITKISHEAGRLVLLAPNGTEAISKIFEISSCLNLKIDSVSLTPPTLDDVFLSYTGHEIRDDSSGYGKDWNANRRMQI